MPKEYRVHATFNVTDLISFTGSTDDEADTLDLRTNSFQEGGDDRRKLRHDPTTREMTRQIEEQWKLETI